MPAALAGIVVGMGVPNAELVVTTVALAIVVTLALQATTKRWLARRLEELGSKATWNLAPMTKPITRSRRRADSRLMTIRAKLATAIVVAVTAGWRSRPASGSGG